MALVMEQTANKMLDSNESQTRSSKLFAHQFVFLFILRQTKYKKVVLRNTAQRIFFSPISLPPLLLPCFRFRFRSRQSEVILSVATPPMNVKVADPADCFRFARSRPHCRTHGCLGRLRLDVFFSSYFHLVGL